MENTKKILANKQINVISTCEIQKNYRKLFDTVKKTHQPLFLSSKKRPEIVILSIDSFQKMKKKQTKQPKKKKIPWREIEKNMKRISKKIGKTNLTNFIIHDRETH